MARDAAGSSAPGPDGEGCPARYLPGEVAQSRTPEGFWGEDVEATPLGLVITDFGIGQAGLKSAASSHPLVTDLIDRAASSDDHALTLDGSTDCIGLRETNVRIRFDRAWSVHELFDAGTRSRSTVKATPQPMGDAAPPLRYEFGNATPAERAANRAVWITVTRTIGPAEDEPMEDFGEHSLPAKVGHAIRVIDRVSGGQPLAEDLAAVREAFAMLLHQPGVDDRFVSGYRWTWAGPYGAWDEMERLGDLIYARIDPAGSDSANARQVQGIARQFLSGVVRTDFKGSGGGDQRAIARCHRELRDWIASKLGDPGSIYHAARDVPLGALRRAVQLPKVGAQDGCGYYPRPSDYPTTR